MNWEAKRIKDIVKVNELTLSDSTNPNYEFNYVDIGSIKQFKITDTEITSFFEAPSRARRIIRKNDILVSTVRTYLKAITFIDFDPKDTIASTGFAVMTPKKIINPKFLSYAIEADYFIDDVIKDSVGTSYPAINSSKLEALSVILPPIETQRKIADYLDVRIMNIDKKIDLLQKKMEQYITLRKAIINEAVNHVGTDRKCCRMKDIGYLYSGLSGKSGGDFQDDENINNKSFIPFTNIFNNDVINPQQLGHVVMLPDEEQNKVKKNDLFFLMSSEDYDGLGKNSLLKDELEDTYLNSFCKGFRITSKIIYPDFLNYLLQSYDYRNKLKIEGKGFTRMNLKSEKIACFTIRFPEIQIQKNIVKMLNIKTKLIDDIIKNIDLQSDTLKTYRRAIINEAVTGKLNIE